MADPFTRTEAIDYIKRRVGGGVVVLEVSPEQVEDRFDDALRWYTARKGIKRFAFQTLTPGVQEYTMPDDTDEVLWVTFPGVQLDIIAAVNPFAFIDVDQLPVAYQSITGVPGGSFYGTLHQILAHAETARRIVGSEPAWEYYRENRTLQIFPRNVRQGLAIARYISTTIRTEDPVAPSLTPINDLRRMSFRDRDIILRYATAQLELQIGRHRRKYGEWAGAGGGKTLDGDTLVADAMVAIEKMDEEIKGLSEPVPFLVG